MLKLKQMQAKQAEKPAEVPQEGEKNPQQQGATGVLSLKNKKANGKVSAGKTTAPELRAQKDLAEMDPIPGCELKFPEEGNIMHFTLKITPVDGMYKGASFNFTINIPNSYPYDPPKVHCDTLIYHPNIDFEGHVCLNILRQEWMPVLSIGSVIFGLMTLFLEPNPDDPLNKEAAQLMNSNFAEFQRNVKQSLRGGYFMGRNFEKLL